MHLNCSMRRHKCVRRGVVYGDNWVFLAVVVGIGVVRGSPDDLEGLMAGFVAAIHVVRRIECA
jgi:hypothetical protein